MIPIVNAPHPGLRQVAKPVSRVDKKLLRLISDMAKALRAAKNPEGVGLAAPQVDVPLRLFIIRPHPKDPISVFINPEIMSYSQRLQTPHSKNGIYEGCLSLPHHYSPLKRSMSITVKYQTIETPSQFEPKLIEKTEIFTGLPAHIIQHEVDHLNGILFIDRTLEQNTKLFRIKGKTWEEIDI
jgi:peptide deformylase